ncbi:hypothetical protein EJB05_00511, partial [Eragrostis curvula]
MATNSGDEVAATTSHQEHPHAAAHQEQQDAAAPQEQRGVADSRDEPQEDSTSSTGSPTRAHKMMEAGQTPNLADYWKAGEIDEAYIEVLRQSGCISDFVIAKENKGDFVFSFDTTEVALLESHLICGFNLPPSHFLERVCKFYKIELVHLKPQAIALMSLFTVLCECWLGTALSLDLWRVCHEPFFYGKEGVVGCVSFNRRRKIVYPPFSYRRSWSGYRWKYFIADCSKKTDAKGKGLLPWYQSWNKAVPMMDDRLKRMVAKVTELVHLGLRGEHIIEEFVRRCFFPLQKREPLAMFGDGPRDPKWLPAEVDQIPEAEVERRVKAILETDLQPRPEGLPVPYSATNPATEDLFGPDPSEGGASSRMVLESSSSEKEPIGAPKRSEAEVFADDVLDVPYDQEQDVDPQSLEQKVKTIKACLLSDKSPSSSAPKAPSPPKTRNTRRGRSKPKSSEEAIVQVQPLRPRKRTRTPILASDAPAVSSMPELPAFRDIPDPGNQVPLSIVFGTLFCGFSRISQTRASQGQRRPCAKKLRVLAGDSKDTTAGTSSVIVKSAAELSSGPSPGPAMFSKIKAEVDAVEAWTVKTNRAYSFKLRELEQENANLKLKLSEAEASPAVADQEAKISELEAALAEANKALAEAKEAHASEVKGLSDSNISLAASVESLKDENKALKENAYTIALFKHHHPNLDLGLLEKGFTCDRVQRDVLMNQAHAAADTFVTALKLIPEAAPAEEDSADDDDAAGRQD